MKKISILFCLAAWLVAPAWAAEPERTSGMTPFQIGFWGPNAQLFPEPMKVMGLRLNLARSDNREVVGLDLGLASRARRMDAIQLNFVNTVEQSFNGVSVGLYGTMGSMSGLQGGLFNTVSGDMTGFQLGLFNQANDATGFQIGLFNRTVSMRGVQIGLVNLIEDGPVTFFPIVNAAF